MQGEQCSMCTGKCSRSRERLDQLRSNLAYWWGSVSRVAYKSKLGPTLHVRTWKRRFQISRTAGPIALKFFYTVRDRLVGCRAQVIGGTPAQFRTCKGQGSLSRSLVRRPQKALYWFDYLMQMPCPGNSCLESNDRNIGYIGANMKERAPMTAALENHYLC